MLRSGADTAERRDWVDELASILWRAEPGNSETPAPAVCAPTPAFGGPRSVAAQAVTRAHEVRPPRRDEAVFPPAPARRRGPRTVLAASAFVAALGLGWVGGLTVHDRLTPARPQIADTIAIHAVVDRIIRAESNGDPNARNRRSTAAGAGQFLDGTWLDMIRAHRPDLARLGEKEALELRFDAALTREMTTRFAERNAAMLTARGLPVTPGTLYLSHFAGGGGAVALLTAPGHVDAASVMASADATGQLTREKIVKANPFLDGFTVAELKSWGERKMEAGRSGLVSRASRHSGEGQRSISQAQ
jgi:hypothetical protein